MEITQIKSRLPLATLLHHYHLKGDKYNRICCPFHEDKTPSMQLYYKTHTCYCFSASCKTHGKSLDVIDFILYKEYSQLPLQEAKHKAILKAQQIIGELPAPNITLNTQILSTAKKQAVNKTELLQSMFSYFKNAICNSKPAKDYLQSRNLDVTKIEVGYNTGQFHHGARKDETLIQNCVEIGLLSPWGVNNRNPTEQAYKVFGKECICFALRDTENNITGLYFRSTINNDTQKHFYLKESKGLYPNYPNLQTQILILTESIIDCASLLQIESIKNNYSLLAAYGTNRLNDEMKTAIQALPQLKEIIFVFDNDEAGNKAVEKYAAELIINNEQLLITKIELPNKDVNETLQNHTEDIFLHLLEQRKSLFFSNETDNKNSNEIENKEINKIAETIENTTSQPNNYTLSIINYTLNTDNPNKIFYSTATATYSILGGIPKQLDQLKVMLSIEDKNGLKSRNKVDLYEDKQVEKLAKEVAEKLNLRKDLLEQDMYKLTELLENHRDEDSRLRTSVATSQDENTTQTYLTAIEKNAAENFLKQENIIKKLNDLLGKTGIVGEERNRIFLLLIAISYKMKEPLHSLIQGSSGSGKTKLVRQISDCIPQENITRFTRISDKALYNFPQYYFKNRLLIIEDVDGLSEEAELSFRELQSGGELRSGTSVKQENGNITGGEKIVSGPIASMSCTTKGEIYEDNMSRVFLIAVDESQEQTKRIINYQNQKASGKLNAKEEQNAKQQLQNIIRILDAKEVVNPYAEHIHLPEEAHKIRRLNDLFQNFIKMVTIINQYQRKTNEHKKLIAEVQDIEIAIEIMFESIVLKVDELDGSLRQFYEQLKFYIEQKSRNYEFNRFEIREATGLGKTQQHHYINRLVELEYLQQNGFANRGFKYKIVYWDNYKSLRERIKNNLTKQIEAIKTEHQPNANRTPAHS
jgi:DNA primase